MLSRDSRAERKLKAFRRAQFRLKQNFERIDWEEDVLLPEVEALKSGKSDGADRRIRTVKLVLQRGVADCGLCALATFSELSYEDVYLVAAKIDQVRRGKAGATWRDVGRMAEGLGLTPRLNPEPSLEDDGGVLAIRWKRGSKHYQKPFREHLVALDYGVIADPADGAILPAGEYLARYRAAAGALMELR